jgi:hypothetical protein
MSSLIDDLEYPIQPRTNTTTPSASPSSPSPTTPSAIPLAWAHIHESDTQQLQNPPDPQHRDRH